MFHRLITARFAIQNQVDSLAKKYSNLLSFSEKLTDELETKSRSFIMLDEHYKSLASEKEDKLESLKVDLDVALKEKVALELKLHKALDDLEKMTTKMEDAITVCG